MLQLFHGHSLLESRSEQNLQQEFRKAKFWQSGVENSAHPTIRLPYSHPENAQTQHLKTGPDNTTLPSVKCCITTKLHESHLLPA